MHSRHTNVEHEHSELIAGLLGGRQPASPTTDTSPASLGMDGGYRGSSWGEVERERGQALERFARLFEPPPTDHDEITYALPPLRK